MSRSRVLAARAARTLLTGIMRVAPTRPWVVVNGWPDGEENSLRVAAAAAARLEASGDPRGRVYLLCDDVAGASRALDASVEHAGHPVARPILVRRYSPRAMSAFVLARVVLYTHGLYSSPSSGHRRVHVLLGHGHGPKSASPGVRPIVYESDLATTNNAAWGGAVIRDQGFDVASQMLVTGNPREDAFDEPIGREALTRLGLDPDRPVVAWLPTYRTARAVRDTGWQDGLALSETPALVVAARSMADAAARHGVQLVTKAHAVDELADVTRLGIPMITTTDLADAGLSFYRFLSLTDGLVSDYSSVWVDYLSSSGSVGLLFKDAEEYRVTRGFNEPHFREVAGELFLDGDAEIDAYFASVGARTPWRPEALASARRRLGLASGYSRTLAVLDAVVDRARVLGVDARFLGVRRSGRQ